MLYSELEYTTTAKKTNPTIKITEATKNALDKLKIIDREPYDSVIQRLLKGAKA